MNRIKNNKSGFSVVELILVLLIISVLGAIGWLVYKNQNKNSAKSVKAVKAGSNTSLTKIDTPIYAKQQLAILVNKIDLRDSTIIYGNPLCKESTDSKSECKINVQVFRPGTGDHEKDLKLIVDLFDKAGFDTSTVNMNSGPGMQGQVSINSSPTSGYIWVELDSSSKIGGSDYWALNPAWSKKQPYPMGYQLSYIYNIVKFPKLGVEITVPESIKDIAYSSVNTPTFPQGLSGTTINLTTDSLTKLDKECSDTGMAPPLGALSKVNGQYPKNPTVDNSVGQLVKQYPDYYIGFSGPQAACSSVDSTSNVALSNLGLLKSSLSTINLIQ